MTKAKMPEYVPEPVAVQPKKIATPFYNEHVPTRDVEPKVEKVY